MNTISPNFKANIQPQITNWIESNLAAKFNWNIKNIDIYAIIEIAFRKLNQDSLFLS
jgi:hypothetical protein